MSEAVRPHPRDIGLAGARALARRAVDKAEQLGLRGAIAVVGASGSLITASRMDAGGPGGMTVTDGGLVVAGIAASGATVSPFFPDGIDPRAVSADGRPANPQDLPIAYVLGIPYAGQHGDDVLQDVLARRPTESATSRSAARSTPHSWRRQALRPRISGAATRSRNPFGKIKSCTCGPRTGPASPRRRDFRRCPPPGRRGPRCPPLPGARSPGGPSAP